MPPVRASLCAVAGAVAFVAGCGGSGDQVSFVAASKCLVRVDGATIDFGTPLHEEMSGGDLALSRALAVERAAQPGRRLQSVA
jgi:hypothetical protein